MKFLFILMQRTGLGSGSWTVASLASAQGGRACGGLWAVLKQGQVVGLVPSSAYDLGALGLELSACKGSFLTSHMTDG